MATREPCQVYFDFDLLSSAAFRSDEASSWFLSTIKFRPMTPPGAAFDSWKKRARVGDREMSARVDLALLAGQPSASGDSFESFVDKAGSRAAELAPAV